jgi:hypothetical protein
MAIQFSFDPKYLLLILLCLVLLFCWKSFGKPIQQVSPFNNQLTVTSNNAINILQSAL